jgi:thiamine-phosphate pyrophosphorylase
MPARQPLPRLWLMTDERLGDGLLDSVARLPCGAGIVFRHYGLPEAERRALFDRVKAAAGPRDLLLVLAGPAALAEAWEADGSHGRGPGAGFRSAPAHDLAELRAAEQAGADLLFVSPIFATPSHPGAAPLGIAGFARLVRATRLPVIALGGMTAELAPALRSAGAYGWAGVSAWSN